MVSKRQNPGTLQVMEQSTSTADLVSQASAQISTLVRDELALAKAELAEKGKRAGFGGGLLGGAGVLSMYGLGLLIALAVVALDLVLPTWLAVLVVMVLVFAIAAIAALIGRAQLQRAVPATPKEAVAGLTADVETVKTAVKEGRHR
jgi:predicted lipid-binding transport protein (Tim44 family)